MRQKVDDKAAGKRLDVYVHDHILKEYSREHVIRLIKSGSITVNGMTTKAGYKLACGSVIDIENNEPVLPSAAAQEIPLDIIYEDKDIIVVNKERGMVVHPGSGNPVNTLVNALVHHTKGNLSEDAGNYRPGIVHRIDKDTSGLLVIAKHDRAHTALAKQFKSHSITREYLAVCKGALEYNSVIIDKPIGRSQKDRKKMDVVPDGKNAVTHIKVIDRLNNATLLLVTLKTGRTHQIRVHLKSISHPIIGDQKYGKKDPHISGQALHAGKLGFLHPETGEYLEFISKPPKDFTDLVDFLKML
jgi:23S rRNA pseudouridine1911/1915/1917 synthase